MTFILRFGAVCGVICGFCIALPGAVEAFTGETVATSLVLGLTPALAVPLLTGLHLSQHGRAGRLGDVGYAVNLLGLGLFGGAAYALDLVVVHLPTATAEDLLGGPVRLVLLGSAAVFVVGTLVFGLGLLRARTYPRPAAWAYGVGLSIFALLAPVPDSPLTSAVHVVVGATLVWLSTELWKTIRTTGRPVRSARPVVSA